MVRILISSPKNAENYIAAVEAAGAEATAIYAPEVDLSYDGLVLSGGVDVDPKYYQQENTASKGIDFARDEAEFPLFRAYFEAGKPILGICRGTQLINIALGGSLKQDIGEELHAIHTRGDAPVDKFHPTNNEPGSWIEKLWGPRCQINSAHHQCLDRLGEGLKVVSRSDEGIIEAVVHESAPLLAVQFHPERLTGKFLRPDAVDGAAVFRLFLSLFNTEG